MTRRDHQASEKREKDDNVEEQPIAVVAYTTGLHTVFDSRAQLDLVDQFRAMAPPFNGEQRVDGTSEKPVVVPEVESPNGYPEHTQERERTGQ